MLSENKNMGEKNVKMREKERDQKKKKLAETVSV